MILLWFIKYCVTMFIEKEVWGMKLVSWNVAGFRACLKKGFEDFFREVNADVFCIEESKLTMEQLEFKPEGYEIFLNPVRLI